MQQSPPIQGRHQQGHVAVWACHSICVEGNWMQSHVVLELPSFSHDAILDDKSLSAWEAFELLHLLSQRCASSSMHVTMPYVAPELLPWANHGSNGADHQQDLLQTGFRAPDARCVCGSIPLLPALQGPPGFPLGRRLVHGKRPLLQFISQWACSTTCDSDWTCQHMVQCDQCLWPHFPVGFQW